MVVDTHCHILRDYYEDIDSVIEESKKKNIILIINGISPSSNREILKIVKEHDNVFGVLGFHPSEVENISEEDYLVLEEQLKEDKIIGIGEIGLDYYWTKENKEEQIILFKRQLEIASNFNYPVIIHNRDATQDIIEILKDYKVRGIMHAFSKSLEVAKIFTKMGFKLGIGGIITFKNSSLKEVIEQIDLENIVLETDSPYLTPEPYRGKTNYPIMIKETVKSIAEIKNISENKVEETTFNNTTSIFDLKPLK